MKRVVSSHTFYRLLKFFTITILVIAFAISNDAVAQSKKKKNKPRHNKSAAMSNGSIKFKDLGKSGRKGRKACRAVNTACATPGGKRKK